jgi:hypothetical protein
MRRSIWGWAKRMAVRSGRVARPRSIVLLKDIVNWKRLEPHFAELAGFELIGVAQIVVTIRSVVFLGG